MTSLNVTVDQLTPLTVRPECSGIPAGAAGKVACGGPSARAAAGTFR